MTAWEQHSELTWDWPRNIQGEPRGARMRNLLIVVGAFVAVLPALAQQKQPWGPRAWCTQGEENDIICEYDTYAQCHESAWGNGSSCLRNPFYIAQPKAAPRATKRRQR